MAKRYRSLLWMSLVFFSFGCGDESDVTEASLCPRFEEWVGEGCRPVEIIGVEEREFSFSRAGLTLHGTLTLPVTEGDYRPPVFVLAHGSGPNDRDATTTGNLGVSYGQEIPTFRILADRLGQQGVAVYRYDKRTCFRENSSGRCPNLIYSYPGNLDDIMVDDFIEDLRAAVKAVSALEFLDGDDITVVGHSQAANFVPLLLDEPEVVGGVLMAGSSLAIDITVVEQLRAYADLIEPRNETEEKKVQELYEMAEDMEKNLAAIRAGTFEGTHYDNVSVAFWENWMARTDNLQEEFTQATKPLLVLQGELDLNVLPSHALRFRSWAEEAGMENVSVEIFPNVTHSFVELTPNGRGIEGFFSSAVIEAMVSWHRDL